MAPVLLTRADFLLLVAPLLPAVLPDSECRPRRKG
jgi:hypothetical protein